MKALLITCMLLAVSSTATLFALLRIKPKPRITDPMYFKYEPYQAQHKPLLKDKTLEI